jgi:hypothetical protein
MSEQEKIVIELKCGNCFFHQLEKVRVNNDIATKTVAFCHRFPPKIPDPLSSLPHPMVNPHKDWCGEFRPAEDMTGNVRKPDVEVDEDPTVLTTLGNKTESGLYVPS